MLAAYIRVTKLSDASKVYDVDVFEGEPDESSGDYGGGRQLCTFGAIDHAHARRICDAINDGAAFYAAAPEA